MTRQQEAVRRVLDEAGRPLTIDEIHESAVAIVPSLGLRTVYRLARRFQEDGDISAVHLSSGPDRYELSSVAERHHHHFHCVSCDRVFDVAGCPGRLSKLVPQGFVLEDHEITLSGRCDRCA